MRSATFGPTPGRARDHRLVAHGDRGREIRGLERAEHRERDLGADALHGLQQAEPLALDIAEEPEQLDLVLAHVSLDRQRRRLAGGWKRLQGAARAMHHVADAADVDDDEILAVGVDGL